MYVPTGHGPGPNHCIFKFARRSCVQNGRRTGAGSGYSTLLTATLEVVQFDSRDVLGFFIPRTSELNTYLGPVNKNISETSSFELRALHHPLTRLRLVFSYGWPTELLEYFLRATVWPVIEEDAVAERQCAPQGDPRTRRPTSS